MPRKPLEVSLPRPHAAQRQVIDQAKRFNVVVCGRRWGKTVLALDRVAGEALKGFPCGWFGPSYKSVSDAWREAQHLLGPVIAQQNSAERRLELIGGGILDFWSLDNIDAPRGRRYKCIAVDEAALIVDFERAWTQSLRPTLADYAGSAWFLSTPKSATSYFKQLFDRGQDPEREDWASWQMPTSTNPHIAASEIEAAREDMPELAFNQEFLAQFISWEGAVFRKIGDAISDGPLSLAGEVAIGVDWAGPSRSGDFTVFTVVDSAGQVLELDRFRGQPYAAQMARLKALYERWKPYVVVAEANSMGLPVIEQLQRDGIRVRPFVTTHQSKAELIEGLALGFEQGKVKIPNNPVLIGELQAFEAKPLPSGLMRYAGPDSGHDDTVMSLALGYSGVCGKMKPRQAKIWIFPLDDDNERDGWTPVRSFDDAFRRRF